MSIRDDRFWGEFLGVDPSEWNSPGVSIRAHVGLSGYRGLWCFRRRDRTVISAPSGWLSFLERHLDPSDTTRLFDEAFLADLLGEGFGGVIGPAFQGSLEPANFVHVPAKEVRLIGPDDTAAYQEMRAQCRDTDAADSGLDKSMEFLMGYFQGSTLAAVAGYRARNEAVGDPCILTHPGFQGRGYGTAVTSAVVQRGLNEGKLLLYQTLEANVGAVRIARKLGYEQYARHVAVRLKNDAPSTERT